MGKTRAKPLRRQDLGDGEVKRVLHQLLEHGGDPSRILELYYWTAEPDVAQFVRQFLALSNSTRLTLATFIGMAQAAPESVHVKVGPNGELTLSSVAVTEVMKLKAMSSTPCGDTPESLH
jgi:hypothetical protein